VNEYNVEPGSGAPTCNFDQLGHGRATRLVFRYVQDCSDIDAISIGYDCVGATLPELVRRPVAAENQVLRNISCRCHHAIGGNAGGEYELPHSFTAKGSHTILVLIENNRDASRVVNFVLFSIVGPMLPEETDRSKVAENVHALGG
jgi:hypothetical protein